MKDLYHLKLHQTLVFKIDCPPSEIEVIRVDGGYIYRDITDNRVSSAPVFVPFSGEFIERGEIEKRSLIERLIDDSN